MAVSDEATAAKIPARRVFSVGPAPAGAGEPTNRVGFAAVTLKQDERALLQLICERGQSYDDLAGLLGISPEEVHERARASLQSLAGTDPDAEVGLTDYLLGQADHIDRADVARFLQQDQPTLDLATDLTIKIRALAPNAALPKLPSARGSRRSAPSTARARSAEAKAVAGSTGPSTDQRKIIGLFAAAGVVLIAAILLIANPFSSDDEAPATRAEDQALADEADAPAEDAPLTTASLSPVSGSGVGGSAEFGVTEQVLFVDVQVDGLAPLKGDEIYLVWLMASEEAGFPLPTPLTPDENGSVGGQIAVPEPATQLVAPITTSVAISQTDRKQLNSEIKRARDAESPLLPFVGEMLASGDLPTAPAPG